MNRTFAYGRARLLGMLLLMMSALGACVSSVGLQRVTVPAPCETTPGASIEWWRATAPNERDVSAEWCAAVGGPLIVRAEVPAEAALPLAVVSWNIHVGAGHVEDLVRDLREGRLTAAPPQSIVLLLQEAERAGSPVPSQAPRRSQFAAAQTPPRPDGARPDIEATARAVGFTAFYAPSMRNGTIREDRGNAILASASLTRLEAIELPFEHQRRVVVLSRIRIAGPDGGTIAVRLVSAHFTNMVPHHLWALSEPARVRQARALARLLAGDEPTILGGDFNSWFGFHDAAYRELARAFPSQRPADRRPTFGPMRLDHLLASLPPGWTMDVRRANDRYGSDHYPLVALVTAR